jgi:hypothetical protein
VSRGEVERETQKIRAAIAAEDTAALEAADMQQLNQQLQALTSAPMGRAARAAWLQEQRAGSADDAGRSGGADAAAAGGRDAGEARARPRASSADNPFAISAEARAQWDALDAEDTEEGGDACAECSPAPATNTTARSSAAAAASSVETADGSIATSRCNDAAGSEPARSAERKQAPSDNPFAIPAQMRAQWEADDHLYSEVKPCTAGSGGLLGSLRGLFGGGSCGSGGSSDGSTSRAGRQAAQPPARAKQPQAPTRRASRVPPAAAGDAAKLQRSVLDGAAGGLQGRLDVPLPLPAQQPEAAGAAADGASTIVDGSPEALALRAEMLRRGAARRARLAQQRQQSLSGGDSPDTPAPGPAAAGASSTAAQQVPASWRAAAAEQAVAAAPSGLTAAVSVQDAQGVTADARPAAALTQAAAALDATDSNPFAVDAAVALDDDAAFELGQQVDKDVSGIQLKL